MSPRRTSPNIAGIDVGEDFLDLALLRASARALEYHRVSMRSVQSPLESLRARLLDACPDLGPGWVALIDSPSAPRDLASGSFRPRSDHPNSRALDRTLRRLAARLGLRLSLFPTPELSYFRTQTSQAACKPHLKAIFRELFGELPDRVSKARRSMASFVESDPRQIIGPAVTARPVGRSAARGIFTRFMLAGFAAYRVLERLGVETFEAYPDLQFRLWSGQVPIVPKRFSAAALCGRRLINARLCRRLGLSDFSDQNSIDQADAEILALSAALARRDGKLILLSSPEEGRFLVALDTARWKTLEREAGRLLYN